MNTTALILMICVQGAVTVAAVYFIVRVLRTKDEPEKDPK